MLAAYHDNPTLLPRVFALLDKTFPGISKHVADAVPLGLDWATASTPFVKSDGHDIICHVGVLTMPLIIEGRSVKAAAVHAVATHPDHRRRGHYREVMSEVIEWIDERYETALLFTDTPALYEPFGFRAVREVCFVLPTLPQSPRKRAAGLRRLDLAQTDDITLLRRLATERAPVSRRLGVVDEHAAFAFNALHIPLWHANEIDTLIAYAVKDDVLRIYDVVSANPPTWDRLLPYLPSDEERIEAWFCPDRLQTDMPPLPTAAPLDGHLMTRGHFIPDGTPMMMPRTAEC